MNKNDLKVVKNDQAETEQPRKAQDLVISFKDEGDFVEGEYVEKVVTYENINGHQVGQHWIAIFLENHSTVIIPAERIKEILVIVKE